MVELHPQLVTLGSIPGTASWPPIPPVPMAFIWVLTYFISCCSLIYLNNFYNQDAQTVSNKIFALLSCPSKKPAVLLWPGACYKCRLTGPVPDLWKQNLNLNKTHQGSHRHIVFWQVAVLFSHDLDACFPKNPQWMHVHSFELSLVSASFLVHLLNFINSITDSLHLIGTGGGL